MKPIISLICILMLAAGAGCSRVPRVAADRPEFQPVNSVYYWKTTFAPDSADMAFLRSNHVKRIYLRMFDVIADPYEVDEKAAVPNATLTIDRDVFYNIIERSLGHMEFTPVVYITLDGLKAMKDNTDMFAELIVKRVTNMCSYNELPNVHELQLDCDWTPSTEKQFFDLCRAVREELQKKERPWRLSSTIRLHQLGREVPPVDLGVLMVYNTGNFDDPDAVNSILHPDDVEPYLRRLTSYALPLDVAYPTYSWQLIFHNRRFRGLTEGLDLADTTLFRPAEPNSFVALKDIPYKKTVIRKGSVVRQENSEYDLIKRTKAMIEERMADRPHSNIIYHLDSKNLSKYSSNEIYDILY